MKTIDSKHILSDEEIIILRQLIGKVLINVHSSRFDNDINFKPLLDPINLKFKEMTGFTVISAHHEETIFGDDFIEINIEQTIEPVSFRPNEQIGRKLPSFNSNILPEFRIVKIEVYGNSYVCESDNIELKPIWQVEIENPGQKIKEIIETENILLFYSENSRLLIKPYGPFPWIDFIYNNEIIDQLLFDKDLKGKIITKLKHEIQ